MAVSPWRCQEHGSFSVYIAGCLSSTNVVSKALRISGFLPLVEASRTWLNISRGIIKVFSTYWKPKKSGTNINKGVGCDNDRIDKVSKDCGSQTSKQAKK